jgi:hypothetical protein
MCGGVAYPEAGQGSLSQAGIVFAVFGGFALMLIRVGSSTRADPVARSLARVGRLAEVGDTMRLGYRLGHRPIASESGRGVPLLLPAALVVVLVAVAGCGSSGGSGGSRSSGGSSSAGSGSSSGASGTSGGSSSRSTGGTDEAGSPPKNGDQEAVCGYLLDDDLLSKLPRGNPAPNDYLSAEGADPGYVGVSCKRAGYSTAVEDAPNKAKLDEAVNVINRLYQQQGLTQYRQSASVGGIQGNLYLVRDSKNLTNPKSTIVDFDGTHGLRYLTVSYIVSGVAVPEGQLEDVLDVMVERALKVSFSSTQ